MPTSDTGASSSVCPRRARARSPAPAGASAPSPSTGRLCLLIAYGLIADGYDQATGNWALVVFFVLSVLTVGTVGFTPGKRLFGLRVVAVDGGRLSPAARRACARVLLCLAIPALIWDRDGRGLHDRLARTVQVRI